ncbi:MAG TPA: hypothetical protein VLM40_17565 [Gemmata sp.]|nr:hypothetical protein [Gemmata sp.]
MKRKRWLGPGAVVVMLAVLGIGLYRTAQRQTDSFPPPGTPIDADVVDELEATNKWLISNGSLEDGQVPTVICAGDITDADLPALLQIRVLFALNLNNSNVTDEGLRHLAGLQNLTSLNLSNTHVTWQGLECVYGLRNLNNLVLDPGKVTDDLLASLAGADRLHILWQCNSGRRSRPVNAEEVKGLSLDGTPVTDKGLKHLVSLNNLTSLSLGSGVTDAGLEVLEKFPKLTSLSFSNTRMTAKGLRHIAGLRNLTTLWLPMNQVNDEALAILAESKQLYLLLGALSSDRRRRPASEDDVRELSLIDPSITDASLKHLAGLRNLESLSLGSGVTDAGLEVLSRFPKLTSVSVRSASVSDAGLKHLTRLKTLATLELWRTQITDAGVELLSDFPNLTSLGLGNAVTDKGVEVIARLPKLTALNLSNCAVTDAGLKHLTKLKNLSSLHLAETQVTASGLAEIKKALPGCRITLWPWVQ